MRVFICFVIIAAASAAEGALEAGLRVKFNVGLNPSAGTSYFYEVPRTVAEAVSAGWRRTRRPSGPMPQLVMHCSQDKVLCALYDDLEDVAGLQIGVDKNQVTNDVFDWEKRGFRKWNTAVDGQCVTMYTLNQYFVSEESLQKSKEERLAARDSSRVLQQNGIWLTGTDGELLHVPSSEEEMIEQGVFTKQACIPWMGQHWYYNMSSTTPCDAENMYSWFPMTMAGQLTSSGFITFGNLPVGKYRDWFERPPGLVVRGIVPRGPQCMYDLSDSPGVLTMHIYYTSTPWHIVC